jgi:Raf kinase inhibitor-like YbhB/YbcL family protein
MVRLSTPWLQLATTLSLALIIAACSSSAEDGATGTGGAPAAAADTGGWAATGEDALKQTFDMGMEVTSPVFNDIRRIPKNNTCGGRQPGAGGFFEQGYDASRVFANTSPPLEWTGVPEGTVSIALMMDSDQSLAKVTSHWVIWNIPADATGLPEAVATTTEVLLIGPSTRQGTNDDTTLGYSGPCPKAVTVEYSEAGRRRLRQILFNYVFHVYALDTELDLGAETTREGLLKAIEGHVLGGGEITGQFAARTKRLDH